MIIVKYIMSEFMKIVLMKVENTVWIYSGTSSLELNTVFKIYIFIFFSSIWAVRNPKSLNLIG